MPLSDQLRCYGSQKIIGSQNIILDLKKSCEISKTRWDLILDSVLVIAGLGYTVVAVNTVYKHYWHCRHFIDTGDIVDIIDIVSIADNVGIIDILCIVDSIDIVAIVDNIGNVDTIGNADIVGDVDIVNNIHIVGNAGIVQVCLNFYIYTWQQYRT